VPHPAGDIAVSYKVTGTRLTAEVQLPPGIDGELVWRGQRRPLPPGRSKLQF
jgi:hypothetical protein